MKTAGVFDALVSTGARLEDACWLEPGLGVASWRNCYDQTRYHKPGHHTLSVYLQGGEQTERLDGPGGHGGTGKVCIMPDHHRSEWLVREEFRFFHLYFTRLTSPVSPRRCVTRRGATCNWWTRPLSTIRRRLRWCSAS